MAAGVPIKAPVAGISCGLITGDKGVYGDFMTMVDIQGLEDFYGDMDFKVAGTHKGITAIQMDLKVHGLTASTRSAMLSASRARLFSPFRSSANVLLTLRKTVRYLFQVLILKRQNRQFQLLSLLRTIPRSALYTAAR